MILHLLDHYEPFLVTPVMIKGFCFVAMARCLDQNKCPKLADACRMYGFRREPNPELFNFERGFENSHYARSKILAEKVYTQSLVWPGSASWISFAADILDKKLSCSRWSQLALTAVHL